MINLNFLQNHEHQLEFISEDAGVSQWRCNVPRTVRIADDQPVYFGVCGYVELQCEDAQP